MGLPELLASIGLDPTTQPAQVRDYPWAEVWKVDAVDGTYWAKRCLGGTEFEPALVDLLAREHPDLGPRLVTARAPWFVTRDHGTVLREAPHDTVDGMCSVQPRYADVQRHWSTRADELAALGVPEVRLADVVELVDDLIDHCRTLLAHVDGALDADAARAIQARRTDLEASVDLLGALGVPDTLQHDDLHDGNVLVDDRGDLRIIDWGDASIAPAFTHLTVLLAAPWLRSGRPGEDPSGRVRDSYLDAWTDLAPLGTLRDCVPHARYVGSVVRAQAWRRCIANATPDQLDEWGAAVPRWLRQLLEPPAR